LEALENLWSAALKLDQFQWAAKQVSILKLDELEMAERRISAARKKAQTRLQKLMGTTSS
jgi:hypothetical protein